MQVLIDLPFFPGFDDEAQLSLYEYPDPEVWVVEHKQLEIQEKCAVEELTETDVIFKQRDYEKDVKSAWIEAWKDSAPENVVESVESYTYGCFNPNHAYAEVNLKEGWQEVMRAFIQENESWLKEQDNEWLMENCDFCGLLSKDIENWPKYLFEDQDGDYIADMIGFMMLRENEDIPFDLVYEALRKVDILSYVFLTEEGLANVVDSEGSEQDDEMRVLSAVKKWYKALTANDSSKDYRSTLIDPDRREEYLDCLQSLVRDKFRHEWFKNYCYEQDDIVHFAAGFLYHRLKIGHTERQDRFTQFMRDYPMDVLTWLYPVDVLERLDDVISVFYRGLAKGNDYELIGLSKEEFLEICRAYNWVDANYYGKTYYADFDYATILEEKYGASFAADYLKAICAEWEQAEFLDVLVEEDSGYCIRYMEELASKCDNDFLLSQLMSYYADKDVDKSIKYASRLAEMWKSRLISEEWINEELDWVFMDLHDMNSDDEEYFNEYELTRKWLLKLLNADFSAGIADLLKPFLEAALKVIREYNKWPDGVQAIETFLNRYRI